MLMNISGWLVYGASDSSRLRLITGELRFRRKGTENENLNLICGRQDVCLSISQLRECPPQHRTDLNLSHNFLIYLMVQNTCLLSHKSSCMNWWGLYPGTYKRHYIQLVTQLLLGYPQIFSLAPASQKKWASTPSGKLFFLYIAELGKQGSRAYRCLSRSVPLSIGRGKFWKTKAYSKSCCSVFCP